MNCGFIIVILSLNQESTECQLNGEGQTWKKQKRLPLKFGERIVMHSGKILVTGGTGFVGSNLVELLVEEQNAVKCLVREKSKIDFLSNLGVEFAYGDITDKAALTSALKDVTAVFHLAGILGKWGMPSQVYWDLHVNGTKFLLEACEEQNVRRLIYCSSAGVLGPISNPPADESYPYAPSNTYERVKTEAEKIVLNYKQKLDVTVLRPEFVYGPKDMHVLSLFKTIRAGKFVLIGAGNTFLHPTFVDDLTQGFLLSLEKQKSIGEVYLIVGQRYVSVKEFAGILSANFSLKESWRHVPLWVANAFAGVSEAAGKVFKFEPMLTHSKVKFFTENRALSYQKAARDLGYKPVRLEDGIKRTVEWYQKNGYLEFN
jgi:nucleoside-diphosphate-sugar epimerase